MEKATVAENFSGGSKDIANSLPKGSSTSHSKSPGKENTPPYKKQRSSVKGKGAGNSPGERNSAPAQSSLDESSESFITETMQKENYKAWLQTGTITDIAEHIYNWTEGNNVILEVGNRLRLLRQKLDKFRNDKSKKLVCIFNKDSNHWVTFVAVHDSDKDVIFYADSFGGTIDSCIVGSVRQKAPDSTINNNDQNVRQNDVIIIKEVEHDSTSYKSLKELLIGECSIDEENIHNLLSESQQEDSHNCAVFALRNAEAILGKGDNVDYSIEEVRERVKNVIRELKKKGSGSLEEGLNSVRRGWAEELGKLSTGRLQTNINYGFSDPDNGTSLKSSKGTLNSGSDDNFVQIDVPGNGSCLFWSVAYAYLTLAEDDNDFHKRYKCLFEDKGIEHSKSFRGQIFNKVLTSKEIIGFDEALVGKFRDKVARYISSDQNLKGFVGTENICHVFEDLPAQEKIICEKLKENNKFHFKGNNLKDINDELIGTVEHSKAAEIISEAYVKCVRDNQFWGSSTEIRAMEQILNLRIGVFKNESLFYPTGPIDGNSSAKIQLYHVDRDTHYKFGLKQSIIDRNTPKQSSPLKNITNSPPKQSGTSHSKSPGKENRLQSSSSKKRMSSTINEGAVKVRRRLDLDENISANLVLDDKGEKEQPESQRSEQENSSTSMNDADANVVLVSQKSSSLQSFSSPIKRGNPATGENDTTPQKVRRVNQSNDDSIVGESEIVIDKLLVFVENFVKNFNNTLKGCYDEIKGKKEKKPAVLSQLINLGLVGGMAATAVSIAWTGVVTAAALASTALITNKIIDDSALKISKLVHSKGAVNAFNTISTLQVSKSQMRKTIIEAGIDIFLHYSSQYMNVTCRAGDSVGMEILANHAAVRVVDYLRSQEDGIRAKNSKAFLRELRTMITKGIVLGGNQGVFKMLGKYLKKCTEELLKKIACFQPMFSLKDIEEIPSLDNIYTKTCLVKITNGGNAIQYYARKKSDARYGHRAMFEWELGSELHGEWKLQERPPQEWRGYTLKPEEFEKKTNEILKKIEGKDQVLKADVWAIKANTEKLLDNNAEMKQMLCNIQSFVARSKSKEVGGDSDCLLQLIFKQDKVEELKSFIDQESIFKFRDKHGYNLLQLAATYDSLEILKYLRQNHGNYFDYKIKDGYGYNLLQLVIENDSVKVLMHLLKHYDEHFDYKIRDDCGLDLLQLAVGNGSIKVLEHLLEHYGKYFNHNIENKYVDGLLQLAVRHDLMEVLEFLLGYYGRNFDYKVEVNCRLDFLQLAIERDSEKMLRYLLVGKEFGCEIEGNKMLELLWSVIEYDSIEVLKCLVKEHYDYYYYQIKDNTEFDLLGLAIQNDSMKTLKYLIENKIFDYQIRNKTEYYYFLESATENNSKKVLKYLVENEIFDYKDKRYALVLSAIQGNLIEVLTYLTKKDNFSYKIKNKGRVSFLLEAAKNGSMEALKYLIEDEKFGYEIWNNKEYYSLLYSASNSVEVLEYLTKGKIFDYEIEGNVKQNLFFLAVSSGNLEVVKFWVSNRWL